MQDEERLARGLKKGDPEAWAAVYEEYFPRIYRYMTMRVRDRMEAEDLTEQVFLKALEAGPSFRWRGAPISSWLFRIARNLVIDYRRTDKSGRTVRIDELPIPDPSNPEMIAERNWEVRRVLEAVGELTPSQREVIHLRFAGGLSTAEVAMIMGRSQGATKALQHSGLAALRKKLAGGRDHV